MVSPRARRTGLIPARAGTPIAQRHRGEISGLIPTRAGNTSPTPADSTRRRAHPRSRGEHICLSISARARLGSSPLAQGTLLPGGQRFQPGGLIPARAGNTNFHGLVFLSVGAHPRSRGEHAGASSPSRLPPGSSPLARGTHGLARNPLSRMGLIPARAGNTGYRNFWLTVLRAHPRSRGEHPCFLHRKNF